MSVIKNSKLKKLVENDSDWGEENRKEKEKVLEEEARLLISLFIQVSIIHFNFPWVSCHGISRPECVRAKIKLEDFYVHVRLDAGIPSIIREHASRFPLEIIPFRSGKQRDIYNLLWLFIRLSNFDSFLFFF